MTNLDAARTISTSTGTWPTTMRSALPWIAWIGLIVVAALGIAGAWWVFTDATLKANQFYTEFAKAGLTLAVGSIIGGGVKLLFSVHADEREKVQKELDFRRSVLNDLKAVYDRVQLSRRLIRAHKTARTYGERLRDILDARVQLQNIVRAVVDGEQDEKLRRNLEINLYKMVHYLRSLEKEYEIRYKPLSHQQRFDEACIKQRIEDAAKNAGDCPPYQDTKSWKMLEEFPRLRDFALMEKQSDMDKQSYYMRDFRRLYKDSARSIRAKIADWETPDDESSLNEKTKEKFDAECQEKGWFPPASPS